MRGESANEMNIYEYFQSFVSSGPFRRAENPLAAQNCKVVNYAGLCLKPAIQHLAGRITWSATDTGKRLRDAMVRR
jgi:hypothetical protein